MDAIIERILSAIEEHREEILSFARDVYSHAELGYKEYRTSALFEEKLKALGLPTEAGLAITGVKGRLNAEKTGSSSVALLGELDALRIPEHRLANPDTGAAHCCGHHAQLAGVYGAALALTRPEVAAALDGQVIFFATPAEEYGEVEFKKRLMREGKLRLGGGKCELIRIGAFDDVDVAVTHHSGLEGITLGGRSGNGFVSKVITIRGTAAHAAAHPEAGRNALSAASLGLQALALNRETFRDEDCVRVHPILTKGGDLVNVVPAEAVLETLVRAKTREAIEDANTKTDRSFRSGALAMDTGLTIETMPGYLPVLRQKTPEEILRAVQAALGTERVKPADLSNHDGGSTDVGDVQHLLPVLTFHTGGMAGNLHTSDFDIVDEEEAYLDTARIFAIHAYLLLKDHAALAKKLKTKYTPVLSDKEDYSAYVEAFRSELVFG